MSLPAPNPLPLTSGIAQTELGMHSAPPDRYSDHAAVETTRYMTLRWIDNKVKSSKEWLVSLGKTGSPDMTRIRHCMGMYRTRQYVIIFSDACLFELASIEDVIEGMEEQPR
jgi:hypothetical protein